MVKRVALVVVLVVAAVAELSHAQSEPGVTSATVAVGTIVPLSGPFAASFEGVANGLKLFIDGVNTRGGINGRKITLHVIDDRGDPPSAMVAARSLVEQEKVFAIVGHFGPGAMKSVADLVNGAGRIYFGAVGSDDSLGDPQVGGRNTFRVVASPRHLAMAAAREVERRGIPPDKVTLVGIDGSPSFQAARTLLQTSNRKLLHEGVRALDTAPAAIETPLVAGLTKKPQAVLLVSPADVVSALRITVQRTTSTPPLVVWTEPFAISVTPPSDLPEAVAIRSSPRADANIAAVARYRETAKKAQQAISDGGVLGWGVAEVFVEGIRGAGKDLSAKSFVSALERLKNFESALGRSTYSAHDHQGQTGGTTTTTRKGGAPQSGQIADACCDKCKPGCKEQCIKDQCSAK